MRKHGMMSAYRREFVDRFLAELLARGKARSHTAWIKESRGKNYNPASSQAGKPGKS